MRKPEQKLYDQLKKHAPPTAWLQRVENLVGEGMPDVHVSGPESECWIELKFAKRPKRATTRLLGNQGLRPSQINWHLKAGTKAMCTYILILDDLGMLYLIDGRQAANINEWPQGECRKRSLAADNWDSIYKVLMSWEGE